MHASNNATIDRTEGEHRIEGSKVHNAGGHSVKIFLSVTELCQETSAFATVCKVVNNNERVSHDNLINLSSP